MTDHVMRIRQRAAQMEQPQEREFAGCFWAEKLPAFFRGDADPEMAQCIQKHLEGCAECNTLLMALGVGGAQEAPVLSWVKQGIRTVLNRALSLQDLLQLPGAAPLAPAMRGTTGDYSIAQSQLELPDGSQLQVSVVTQGEKRIFSASCAGRQSRRYEIIAADGTLLKSMDQTASIKIEWPQQEIVLLIDGQYELRFKEDAAL